MAGIVLNTGLCKLILPSCSPFTCHLLIQPGKKRATKRDTNPPLPISQHCTIFSIPTIQYSEWKRLTTSLIHQHLLCIRYYLPRTTWQRHLYTYTFSLSAVLCQKERIHIVVSCLTSFVIMFSLTKQPKLALGMPCIKEHLTPRLWRFL